MLRPVVADDLPWLRLAAADPSVAEHWDHGDGGSWIDDVLDDDEVVPYVVELDGRPIGYAQWARREDDPAYRSASIDLFLVAHAQGGGHGRDVVRTLAPGTMSRLLVVGEAQRQVLVVGAQQGLHLLQGVARLR